MRLADPAVRRRVRAEEDRLRRGVRGAARVLLVLSSALVAGAAPAPARAPARPFPQHVAYRSAAILPALDRAVMDDDVRAAYDDWRAQYLVRVGAGPDGVVRYRVAFGPVGSSEHATTVSEGQGWGLIIVALMAGHEPAAREIVDGLWRFARDHPSPIDPRLMTWRVPAGSEGSSSAFDGDADLAYGLLLADAQWGSGGDLDYRRQADALIEAIAASTLGPRSRLPLLGDWVDPDGDRYNEYAFRTSDAMLADFAAFEGPGEAPIWRRVRRRVQRVLRSLQLRYAPGTGLVPDFAVAGAPGDTAIRPADPGFLEGPHDGGYSWNACRVPLRLALHALLTGDRRSRAMVRRISRWAERAHDGDPSAVRAGYALDGTALPGGEFVATAFLSPFGVAAMLAPGQQAWLDAVYATVRDERQGYYEDSINLLSLLAMSGNFWGPTGP